MSDPSPQTTVHRTARDAELARGATRTVALIGNPNTGKTSLFNALTGFSRHVANYPGVTVEVASGRIRGCDAPIELLDLPGTYSLAARSPDEQIVADAVWGRLAARPRPDALLVIVDACNLQRNLYLLSQALELELPVVVAVNMIDLAAARGLRIDFELLAQRLGVPAIPVVAVHPATIMPLVVALQRATAAAPTHPQPPIDARLAEACRGLALGDRTLRPAEALRVLADRDGQERARYLASGGSMAALDAARERLFAAGIDPAVAEVRGRYAWVDRVLNGVVTQPARPILTWSDRLDHVLTHKVWGPVVLFGVLFVLFQAIFPWAKPLMEQIEAGFDLLGRAAGAWLPEGALRSLVVDGVIAGVAGVLVFLPQIMILFAFIAVLEDCGYMTRAAHLMDRVMRGIGLSGRALIPLLSSFACAVPAIMGARVIADRRERFLTIMIAPFMSCSARLPVYVLMIAAFVPERGVLGGWVGLQGLVMLAMYLVGVVVAIPVAWLLKRTVLAGPASGFVLELPSYKVPGLRAMWQRMYFAARSFIIRAGSVILVVNLVVWALAYFPRDARVAERLSQQAAAEGWGEAQLESALAGAWLRESYLGRAGHAIEPVLAPLGWDWRIGVGVIASFPAREVIVATLGTVFNLGAGEDETSEPLRDALSAARWPDGRPLFTLPVALSIMVFFALCAQCASTLAVIARETGSWGWAALSFFSMTTIAYFAAWGVSAGASAAGL
ncbi:MAG: ferrous iron transport protein B [Phycisphaerae bacterium]|nr:ferrous iron transport protein B [Phycisphaerae bacterium]